MASQRSPRKIILEENLAKIPLGVDAKYGYTIIDKDFSFLNNYKWTLDHGYARGVVNKKLTYLHHLIIGKPSKGKVIDHINRNRLDNRKINLRNTDSTQNLFNSSLRSDNKSGYKGVFWDNTRSKWKVNIGKKNVGRFTTLSAALFARKRSEEGVISYA